MAGIKKTITALAVTLGLVVAALGLSTGTAQAATYGGQCGSGYGVVDRANLGTLGTVFLTYNNGSGYNCVVTIRNGSGGRLYMDALVSLAGDPWIDDPGDWTTYAGPVRVYARGQCIDWGGVIEDEDFFEFDTHCG